MPREHARPAKGRLIATLVALLALVAACATTSRPTTAAAPGVVVESDAGESDAGDSADAESDAESDGDNPPDDSPEARGPCPTNMVLIASDGARFCVDKYEASLVEIDGDGKEKPYPHWLPVDGHTVRAVSQPGVFPQGYISEVQAEDACEASSKRLCSHNEWKTACMGPSKTTFPYGDARQAGVCHDTGKSAVASVFGARAMTDPVAQAPQPSPRKPATKPAAGKPVAAAKPGTGKTTVRPVAPVRPAQALKGRAAQSTHARATRPAPAGSKVATAKVKQPPPKRGPAKASARPASITESVWAHLNDPRLGQVEGALSRTGSHDACMSGYGALDMVGNLHEWVKTDEAKPRGLFAGGYYLDTSINGDGCNYKTTAHAHEYHDYSTGFRCCADASE